MEKRGQMRLSFGILFSIFLIIVFIFFAFKIIVIFLDVGECADTGKFFSEFQSAVDRARLSSSSTQSFKINLDPSIDSICFFDLDSPMIGPNSEPDSWSPGDNFFMQYGSLGCNQLSNYEFNGINVTKIIEDSNPRCFGNGDEVIIKKSVYSRLVDLE